MTGSSRKGKHPYDRPRRPGIPATEDLRILVVDDRPENAKLLDRLLRRWGHRDVTCTTRSADVVPLFAEQEFDLLLLDLHMPRRTASR